MSWCCDCKYFFLFFLSFRLVCSLAALSVQVQVPARACRGCQHPAGRDGAVRKEQTPGQRHAAASFQGCTPKSCLSGRHYLDWECSRRVAQPHLTVRLVSPPTIIADILTLHTTLLMDSVDTWSRPSSPGHFNLTRQISWLQREKPFTHRNVHRLYRLDAFCCVQLFILIFFFLEYWQLICCHVILKEWPPAFSEHPCSFLPPLWVTEMLRRKCSCFISSILCWANFLLKNKVGGRPA